MDCGRWMDGKKFSPIAGTRLQLKLLNRDKRNFSIFLKNCSEEQRLEIVSYSLRIQRRETLGSFKEFFTLECNSLSEEFKFDYHDIVDKMTTEREFNRQGRHQVLISSTFYSSIFCTKVISVAFSRVTVWLFNFLVQEYQCKSCS
jgi:hypothetical protein